MNARRGPTSAPAPAFAVPLPDPGRGMLARRAIQVVSAAARHFGAVAWHSARSDDHADDDAARARALRLMFEDLGATWMKFGQLIGSAPGVFGDVTAAEFRSCLDTGPALSFAEMRSAVELELGMNLDDAFAQLDPVPIAAASIAVVYRARTHDGRAVAVKVQRPDVAALAAADLNLMRPLFEFMSRRVGLSVAGALVDAVTGLREQIAEELDLRNEMRAMQHHCRLLEQVDLPYIVVPEPVPELCGRTVLTMELLDGVAIDDLAAIEALGHDPRPRVEQLLEAWFITTLRNGVFHGDIHAGNLMVLRDGRVGVLDWGIVGRLDPSTHRFFRRLIEGALGDAAAWDDVADHFVDVYGDVVLTQFGLDQENFRRFVRAQIEPVLALPFGEVSLAALVQDPAVLLRDMQADEAGTGPDRSLRETISRWRDTRRRRRATIEAGGTGSSFDRGMFLLGKQLLYFERYGRMFLADRPIVADREFFEQVLAADPVEV
ncbi:MAG: AarF/ABC1/UbiB kinase family protein [Acidimicrobiia bacterium]|nr:AarF/ABC1/UbiB kinase family protein [Acidimicrobiia bacterium]